MHTNHKEYLITLLKAGKLMIDADTDHHGCERSLNYDTVLDALLKVAWAFIYEPEQRAVIKTLIATREACEELNKDYWGGTGELNSTDIENQLHKRIDNLISRIENL